MMAKANIKSLYSAIDKLKQIYPITDHDAQNNQAFSSVGYTHDENLHIRSVLQGFMEGGRRTGKIIEELADVSQLTALEAKKKIAVFTNIQGKTAPAISFISGDTNVIFEGTATAENSTVTTKLNPGGTIIQVLPADLTPCNRFNDAVALFLTTIPTIEMSRAVPYLDLKVILPRGVGTGRPGTNAITTYTFLYGAKEAVSSEEKFFINSSTSTAENGAVSTAVGMELFMSPQTMVNADETGEFRLTPVLDKFRPLLTIKSLEFSVIPTFGMMSYKSGKLNLTLHDRSRMGEVADLVRPDLYSNVEMLIEYGWSHPDDSDENVYGQLINNMRAREKYGIMNSSFTFNESGQVDITLELFMKGVVDFTTTKITASKEVEDSARFIKSLTDIVSASRANINEKTKSIRSEVRGQVILDTASDITTALSVTDETKEEIRTYLQSMKNSADPDVQSVIYALTNLYGTNGKGGSVKGLETTLDIIIKKKMDALSNGKDPMLDLMSNFPTSPVNVSNKKTHVSLAKIMYMFVVQPILATGKFDEVQLIFYPFNSAAAGMRSSNVGSFPIDIQEFTNSWKSFITKRQKFNVTIREWMDWISNVFIEYIGAPGYGMSTTFKSDVGEDGSSRKPSDDTTDRLTDVDTEISKSLKALGVEDGVFSMPKIELYVEAVPEGVGLESDIGDEESTILRIHVFDAVTSPYSALVRLLDAMLDNNLGTFGEANKDDKDASSHAALATRVVDEATRAGLIEVVNSSEGHVYQQGPLANANSVKEFVSGMCPTLRFGTQTSGIKGISIQTLQDPLLATVHMERAGLTTADSAPGQDPMIVPMQMLPTQLSMDIFGCPLMVFGQQFFVDVDTGTTIDNVYGVMKITHKIEQGKFDTSVEMTNIDAYGRFRSANNAVGQALEILKKATPKKS